MELTADRLRELIAYDSETGVFRWRSNEGIAGYVSNGSRQRGGGYRYISVDARRYSAHRLAWLYVTGQWPAHEVDHIDGNRSNNRFANLRDVSHAINMHNRIGARSDNKSTGVVGVSFYRNKFIARTYYGGRQFYLGGFSTADEASAAYKNAKAAMGLSP